MASRSAALPVEVPVPLAVGGPADGYPFAWYVSPWLAGRTPTATVDRPRSGGRLGRIRAGPPAGGHGGRARPPEQVPAGRTARGR